ncbi:large ribosomal subunit protein uL4m isoform X1 [Ascaphus truei]|uniref:large ribosomal subunit protein uL4m isoform X1 n=1 Tax=Ascaphus truei TaxID=8439 RepID=UPI003F5A5246
MMLRGLMLSWERGPGRRLLSSVFSSETILPPNLILPPDLKDGPGKPQRPPVDLSQPILRTCKVSVPAHLSPKPVWLESLKNPDDQQLGLVHLHPDVFTVPPRIDILHQVVTWQKNFKRISYAKVKTRAEVRGGGKKPWRQKGSGRSRQGSIRSPLWRGGGIAHGPRGPTSYYYMLPMKMRVLGLKIALSMKLAQFRLAPEVGSDTYLYFRAPPPSDSAPRGRKGVRHLTRRVAAAGSEEDLHIIDSLDIPTQDPQFLTDLLKYRHWGESVLIVDVDENLPEDIMIATVHLKTINLIPAVGLNVYSMLKHQTVVLTVAAVDFLEEKLLWHDSRYASLYPYRLPYSDFP